MPSRAEELLKARLGDEVEIEKQYTLRQQAFFKKPPVADDPFDSPIGPPRDPAEKEKLANNPLLHRFSPEHSQLPVGPKLEQPDDHYFLRYAWVSFVASFASKLFTDPITMANVMEHKIKPLKKGKWWRFPYLWSIFSLYLEDGKRTFYRNFPSNALRFGFNQALVFPVKDKLRYWQNSPIRGNELLRNSLSGGFAGLIPPFLQLPFDAIGAVQGQKATVDKSVQAVMLKIFKNKGPGGFWPEARLTFLVTFLFRGTNLGIYDTYVRDKRPLTESFCISWVLTYSCYMLVEPIQCVRADIFRQGQGFRKEVSPVKVFQDMYKSKGWKGFWAGSPRLWYSSLTMSTCVWFYDYLQRGKVEEHGIFMNILGGRKHEYQEPPPQPIPGAGKKQPGFW